MSLQYGLLGLLNYSDMTGYELDKTFQDSLSHFWRGQRSQIYRELNKMEEMGWLSSRIHFQEDKPNQRIYSITEKGKEALAAWLDPEAELEFSPMRNEMLMHVFFSGQNKIEDNIRWLKRVEQRYLEQYKSLQDMEKVIHSYSCEVNTDMDSMYWMLTGKYGLAYNQMHLEWVRNSIAELEQYLEQEKE
ncbi:MAG: PadR family transcriptional regulator [Clostridiales bacterium]|nr:PadR family transcriptional regulator [Clostridiales bacterium]